MAAALSDIRQSQLVSHDGRRCCEAARAWFRAMDAASQKHSASVFDLGWLHAKYSWGACPWPLHWCEAAAAESLDCGAFAAISQNLLERRGLNCARLQCIERASGSQVALWMRMWEEAGVPHDGWIFEDGNVYHELLCVEAGERVQVYDSTTGAVWPDSPAFGFPGLVRMRLCEPIAHPVTWGGIALRLGEWVAVEPDGNRA